MAVHMVMDRKSQQIYIKVIIGPNINEKKAEQY